MGICCSLSQANEITNCENNDYSCCDVAATLSTPMGTCVTFWNKNGSREFLDKLGFKERRVGDLGPIYGFQWRHFGAEYIDCDTDYKGKGKDQLAEVVRLIKEDPESRRIVMTAWNPLDNHKMVLPACHTMVQFYVREKSHLSCLVFQRSGDLGLGIPFNIASYALLTCLLAHVCGLKPEALRLVIGDAHVYSNHIEQLLEQSTRTPYAFPKLVIDAKVNSIDNLACENFKLLNYRACDSLKMKMAV